MPKINRRLFLTGLGGVTLGLPLLESLAPRDTMAQVDDAPAGSEPFVVIFRQACGVQQALTNPFSGESEPESFWPRTTGSLTLESVQGRALDELESHLDRMLVVSGVKRARRGVSCAHTAACNIILTASDAELYGERTETHALGESVDNFLAERINPGGRAPLFLQAGRTNAWGIAPLSYIAPRTRRTPAFNPLVKYREMIGYTGDDPIAAEQLRLRRQSVNDLVREQMHWLLARPQLSDADRRRLELHQQNIRDLEQTMARSCLLSEAGEAELEAATTRLFDSTVPAGENQFTQLWHEPLHECVRLHMDLVVLAIACGYTRIGLLSVGTYNNGAAYRLDGLGTRGLGFHQISHRATTNGDPSPDELIPEAWRYHHEVDRIHARDFNYLLDRMAATENAYGPLIDQGVCVWLNDMAVGSHSGENLPLVCAGSANGFLRTGARFDVREHGAFVTHNRFLNTLINAAGVRKADGAFWDDFGGADLPRGVIDAMIA